MALTDIVSEGGESSAAARGDIGTLVDILARDGMSGYKYVAVPVIADVKSGVVYGKQGTELTGTYVGGGGLPMLTSGAVDSLVSAIWAKTLPLGAAPTPTYGDTTLTVDELDVLAHAVWSKTLP